MTKEEKKKKEPTTELALNGTTVEVKSEMSTVIKKVVAEHNLTLAMMKECYRLNVEAAKIASELADKKNELKERLAELSIGSIETPEFTMKNSISKSFKGWKDENELMLLIPEPLRGIDTTSPDRKKIEALVKSKDLPYDILNLRKFSNVSSLRFSVPAKKIQTD